MKKIISSLIIFMSLTFLVSCNKKHSDWFFAMGTTISIEYHGGKASYFDDIFDLYMLYTQISSSYLRNEVPASSPYYNFENVYSINENRGIKPVKVSDELFELIEYALFLIDDTNGYFNPLIGNAVNVWKDVIKKYEFKEVSKEVFDEAIEKINEVPAVDVNKIVLDKINKTVYIEDETLLLDLGAVAKGYVTKLAADYLISKGIKYYMIDSGSSNLAMGTNIEKRPYRIALQDPMGVYENYRLGIVKMVDINIVTSGFEKQNFTYDGHYYHHIVSPFDYIPRDNFVNVIIIGDDAGQLDAYTTAVFSMTTADAIEFLESKGLYYVLYENFTFDVKTNLPEKYYDEYQRLVNE